MRITGKLSVNLAAAIHAVSDHEPQSLTLEELVRSYDAHECGGESLRLRKEGPLRAAIIRFAAQYGRYGYRQVTGLLWAEGWDISRSRVERIWKQEGLRVWAAAGFMDTLIRWKMEPEVAHGYAKGLYERVQG